MKLVGTGEIQKRYNITRIQVFRLLRAGDWPEPFAEFEDGRKVWESSVISRHVAKLRRTGRVTEDGRVVPWRYLLASKS